MSIFRFAWKFEGPEPTDVAIGEALGGNLQGIVRENGVVVTLLEDAIRHMATEEINAPATTHEMLLPEEWKKMEALGGELRAIRRDGPLGYFFKDETTGKPILRVGDKEWRTTRVELSELMHQLFRERPFVQHHSLGPLVEPIRENVDYEERARNRQRPKLPKAVVHAQAIYKACIKSRALRILSGWNSRLGRKRRYKDPVVGQLFEFMSVKERSVLEGNKTVRFYTHAKPNQEAQLLVRESPFWAKFVAHKDFTRQDDLGKLPPKPSDKGVKLHEVLNIPKWIVRALYHAPIETDLNAVPDLTILGPDLTAKLNLSNKEWRQFCWMYGSKTLLLARVKFGVCFTKEFRTRIRHADQSEFFNSEHLQGAAGIIRSVIEWEQEGARQEAARQIKKLGLKGTTRFDYNGYASSATVDGLKFTLLQRPIDIALEGTKMKHCVGNYVERAASGICAIYVVEGVQDKENVRATMELKNNRVQQIYHSHNHPVNKRVLDAAVDAGKKLWSKVGEHVMLLRYQNRVNKHQAQAKAELAMAQANEALERPFAEAPLAPNPLLAE